LSSPILTVLPKGFLVPIKGLGGSAFLAYAFGFCFTSLGRGCALFESILN